MAGARRCSLAVVGDSAGIAADDADRAVGTGEARSVQAEGMRSAGGAAAGAGCRNSGGGILPAMEARDGDGAGGPGRGPCPAGSRGRRQSDHPYRSQSSPCSPGSAAARCGILSRPLPPEDRVGRLQQ